MPDKLTRTRPQMQIVLQALVAAATHSTNAEAEYHTWKRFIESHPEQQVFELVVKKESSKK